MSTDIELEILHSIIYRPNEATFKRITGMLIDKFASRSAPPFNVINNIYLPLLSIKNCMYRLTDKFPSPDVALSRTL